MTQRVSLAQGRHFQLRAVFQLYRSALALLAVTALAVLTKGGARPRKLIGRRIRRRLSIRNRLRRAPATNGDQQNWQKEGGRKQDEQTTVHLRVHRFSQAWCPGERR